MLPVSKSCLPVWCFQWHGAALRRWSRRRSTRLSPWRSAASTDRRPRSLHQGVWGYGGGLATSRCPYSVGWGLGRASSSSPGQWGLGRPGWVALHATKTSCGCIARRSSGGQTLVMWTRTERVAFPCLDIWQVLTGWGGELNPEFMLRRERLAPSLLSPLLLSRDSLETKTGAPECCQAACWMDSALKVERDATWNVFGLPFSQTGNSQDLNVAKPPFGFFNVYKMWMNVVYFEALRAL